MSAAVLFAAAALASAQAAPGGLQELVDGIFEKYLPPAATWQEVKACRAKCGEDASCVAHCPQYTCPWARISAQCGSFNSTRATARECHEACGHGDFACHFKCPMSKPTSLKELRQLGDAVACHAKCGHDRVCHKTACACPFAEKQALCAKLDGVVECHRNGGSHSTCKLDREAKELLLAEPWSLVKDVADHVVDHLLPLPDGQQATEEEVRECHMHCGFDSACHKACPSGPYGIVKDHCEALDTTTACHRSCGGIACPFGKMKCHMTCPMSMPSSVRELKDLADHIACHSECGRDEACHKSCLISDMWARKVQRCGQYDAMVACHKGCAQQPHCHASCPRIDMEGAAMKSLATPPGNVVKEVVSTIIM